MWYVYAIEIDKIPEALILANPETSLHELVGSFAHPAIRLSRVRTIAAFNSLLKHLEVWFPQNWDFNTEVTFDEGSAILEIE